MEKINIRKQFLDCRKQLDLSTYSCLSQQAQQQLIGSECFRRARTMALYSPIHNEVLTRQMFIAARELDKQVYYPRVVGDQLEFIEVCAVSGLVSGAFGVAEPVAGKKLPVVELDLIVVPGVAFDLQGYRLGYGRGFYDRQLAGKSAATAAVGLCFESQLCELLPTEAHDQALDYIATETRFIPCHI
ncbi:MAG: 5-formyltetrahydrofolate cyclo-ligase [Thermodesulfobacteriota bacterium]|nr:5-formyltetrahydrofolate cyclo-ligase [Thermodesulfobacteriota bacterium]